MQSAPIRAAPTAAIWPHHESPSARLRTPSPQQVNVVSEENVFPRQHSPQARNYPLFITLICCFGLDISRLQLISSSRSAARFRLFSCVCPASANPNRNVTQVIRLPINKADRGKTGSIQARKEGENSHHLKNDKKSKQKLDIFPANKSQESC